MTNPRYTPAGLPVLTRDAILGYAEENHNPDRENVPTTDMGAIVREENPELFRYIGELLAVEEDSRGTYTQGLIQGLAIMYGVLKHQGEINELEKLLE